ncbi:hypothetical protein M405DRAFT_868097 [Rhizopogon salebrosus TDB-379]|nr:hypothetical protein M405DRAFT_868097 [Rhizopogon salebrosus TDB-379]
MKKKKEQEKARDVKNRKNTQSVQGASSDSSRPRWSGVPRQSGGAAQSQLSSELHAPVSTLSSIPAVAVISATASTTSLPDAVIQRAGRWTRFRLYICCMSARYTNGHD